MLAKIRIDPEALEPHFTEELADTLFEIGRTQSQKLRWSEAIYWLERAYDTISDHALEALSSDAEELQISIMHGMARALIKREGEESRAKAWDLVHKLDVEYGERLVVLLLKLDLFALDPAHPPEDHFDVLEKIVRTVHLTETNIKTILHHVHKLRARNPSMAHTILVTLFSERLLGAEQPKWLEGTLVATLWNCTTSTGILNVLNSLGELLDTLKSSSNRLLSPSATHAAQIVRSSHSYVPQLTYTAFMEANRSVLQPG